MGSYEVVEAVALADCALAIEGATLADLFETAAQALAELMVDPATIAARDQREVTLAASSLDRLFYDWLAELIFLKDSEQLIVTGADVDVELASPCRLRARCIAGVIDRSRTVLRADPKAVTFHQFTLEPRAAGWRAHVVIDI